MLKPMTSEPHAGFFSTKAGTTDGTESGFH